MISTGTRGSGFAGKLHQIDLPSALTAVPSLRRALFAPGGCPGCVEARTPPDEVRQVVLGHDEFVAYREKVRGAFDDWRREHESHMYRLGVGTSPKALIRELSEDLLGRFVDLTLIDRYDVYQCRMDHWDEVMQHDVYTAEEIGICVAYIGAKPALAGGDIIVLRMAGQDPVCLSHLLNAPVAARQKARMALGDAIVHIRAAHLAEIESTLPRLREQRAIAAVLTDMDAEIAALERRLDKIRALKQGMMQQLLTGAIRLPIPDAVAENGPGG